MSESRDRYVLLCQQALVFAVVASVAAPAAGVVTLDIVSPSGPSVSEFSEFRAAPGDRGARVHAHDGSLVTSDPVVPRVKEVALTKVEEPELGTRHRAEATPAAEPRHRGSAKIGALSEPEAVRGFATVGVTWQHGEKVEESELAVSVRTKKDGVWSGWEALEYHDDHQPDPGSLDAQHDRPGTEAYVVGDVDDVQVKAVTPDGTVPEGMKVAIVDPGVAEEKVVQEPAIDAGELSSYGTDPVAPVEPADPVDPADPAESAEEPAITPVAATAPKPTIYSRAQWGADERMRDKSSLRYGTISAGFVHHTVNANDYTKAQVPAIIRGIYAYHTQSRGWSDIGYNFLVDRFGRIWEGRYGGVDRAVVGAHTLGYNDYSFAMSAIGNFETAQPTAAMLDSYARLFAWKLSLHGVAASSTRQKVGSKYFPAINGHRDAGSTACPGKYLYAQLPAIRSAAAKYQSTGAKPVPLNRQLSGSAWGDLVLRDKATQRLTVLRTGGQVGYGKRVEIGVGFGGMNLMAVADLNGDRRDDLLARRASDGAAFLYAGSATGRLTGPVRSYPKRFKRFDSVFGVGDWDGDGRPDLAGRKRSSNRLVLLRNKGGGVFRANVVLAEAWGYSLTTGVGDFNGDKRVDLVARDAKGLLFLIPGAAGNKIAGRRQIGLGFGAADLIAGRGDVTGDGRPDLLVRMAATKLTRVYTGDGRGGVGQYLGHFTNFKPLNWIAGAGQFTGTSHGDVLGRNAKGKLFAYPARIGKNVEKLVPTATSLAGTDLLLNVGDWNHDGRGDVMTRNASGQLSLLLGNGADVFAAPVVAGTGWQGVDQVVSVGDVNGDGHQDLMTRVKSTGVYRVYPGNGKTGFLAAYDVRTAAGSERQVGGGLLDGDGVADSLVARADGTLWVFASARRVASGLAAYDQIVRAGDLDGDGYQDLVARNPRTGGLDLIPGRKSGTYGPARFLASGLAGYDLLG